MSLLADSSSIKACSIIESIYMNFMVILWNIFVGEKLSKKTTLDYKPQMNSFSNIIASEKSPGDCDIFSTVTLFLLTSSLDLLAFIAWKIPEYQTYHTIVIHMRRSTANANCTYKRIRSKKNSNRDT